MLLGYAAVLFNPYQQMPGVFCYGTSRGLVEEVIQQYAKECKLVNISKKMICELVPTQIIRLLFLAANIAFEENDLDNLMKHCDSIILYWEYLCNKQLYKL